MTTIIDLGFPITAPPASFDPSSSKSSPITKPVEATLIQAGNAYLAYAQRTLAQRSFDEDDKFRQQQHAQGAKGKQAAGAEDDLGVGDEEEDYLLLQSDPKKWKDLDLYAVLGLSHLRYLANEEQIKIAHRKKVLKHHPDKKANQGDSNDDAFFKCIQKAYEVFLDPEKRRQFDSIDPYYIEQEDEVPTADEIEKAADPEKAFFDKFNPVFEREAHFCATHAEKDVPRLGTIDSTKDETEAFYNFWYNFDSWRTFEWLDKEVNEGSNSRDDKRFTEKKNRGERARRKKEDNARLRTIVDVALSCDPRIKKQKQKEKEEREKKQAARTGRGKQQAPKLSAKEKEEIAKKEKEEQDKREAEERAQRAVEKKIREAQKRKERKERQLAKAAAAEGGEAPADAAE